MKPILFNTEMVSAILDGRKTTTRRVMKSQPVEHDFGGKNMLAWVAPQIVPGYEAVGVERTEYLIKPYQPGDVLWVRETWQQLAPWTDKGYLDWDNAKYYYAADGDPDIEMTDDNGFHLDRFKWRPSIHMPREAARLFLLVIGVRAERLCSITNDDVIHEGVSPRWRGSCKCSAYFGGCMLEPCPNRDAYDTEGYMIPFAELWDSTIKPADRPRFGWDANPWVWVIEFARCEKPEGWCAKSENARNG